MNEIIERLNQVIYEAIYTGGDAGGPYNYNSSELELAINSLLISLQLDKDYTIYQPRYEPIKIISKEEEKYAI